MSIIDEMTACGRTNPLERDIYLVDKILELSTLLNNKQIRADRRLTTLEEQVKLLIGGNHES